MKKKPFKSFISNYPRTIFLAYLSFGILMGLVLWIPGINKTNIGFIDSVFTSISALSNTGLAPINFYESFSVAGKIIILLIAQVGGFGIIFIFASVFMFAGKRMGLNERNLIASEQNTLGLKGLLRQIKHIFIVILSAELLATIFFTFYIFFRQPFSVVTLNFGQAILEGLYTSVALVVNAGVDLSIEPIVQKAFYLKDYYVIYISYIFIFIGSVGYYPISELILFVKAKRKKETFKFSFLAKLLFFSHITILFLTFISFFLLEMNHSLNSYGFFGKITGSFFLGINSRSSGLAFLDQTMFRPATNYLTVFLMIMGVSPNSAGGGIRTTTVIILLASLYSFLRNRNQVLIGKKAIKDSIVRKTFIFLTGSIFFLVVASFLLIVTNPKISITTSIFEVISAFGTVGLSLGATSLLNVFGKLIIIISMFVGRISLLTILSVFSSHKDKTHIQYPEIDLLIS